jgi:hypothetical protein
MRLAAAAGAQRYQVGLIVAAAVGAGHQAMVVQALGVIVTSRDSEP